MKLIRNGRRTPDEVDYDHYDGGVRHLVAPGGEMPAPKSLGRPLKKDLCAKANQFRGSNLRR
jgi:hypothetical protein